MAYLSPFRNFWVMKFANTAGTVKHKLAYILPSVNEGELHVFYKDQEFMNVPTHQMPVGLAASGQNLSKQWVRATVDKEMSPLRKRLIEECQMPLHSHFHWLAANDCKPETFRSPPRLHKKSKLSLTPRTDASTALNNFRENAGTRGRRATMAAKVAPYTDDLEKYMPTSWSKTPLTIPRLTLLDMTDVRVREECAALCARRKLLMPGEFLQEIGHHYGYYEDGKLVFYLAISVAVLNGMPVSIGVSVDVIASISDTHIATDSIDAIKKLLCKRRLPCVLFAQVVTEKSARKWWRGQLEEKSKSAIPAVLFHEFDGRYPIYEGCLDFATFI